MLSLFGALLGFGTSFLPKALNYFEEKRDQAHEALMMDKQIAANAQAGAQKLQMVQMQSETQALTAALNEQASTNKVASQWVVNLSASVRPVMTYALFLEFFALTLAVFNGWISQDEYNMVWNNEMQAVWAAVVSFWFGSRSFNRVGHT